MLSSSTTCGLLKDLYKLFVADTLFTPQTFLFPYRSVLQVMKHLVSSWCNDRSLPESYILPPEKRPGKLTVPLANKIPVIDLGGHDQTDIIQQIFEASLEFGFFQVPTTSFLSIILSDNDLFLSNMITIWTTFGELFSYFISLCYAMFCTT